MPFRRSLSVERNGQPSGLAVYTFTVAVAYFDPTGTAFPVATSQAVPFSRLMR